MITKKTKTEIYKTRTDSELFFEFRTWIYDNFIDDGFGPFDFDIVILLEQHKQLEIERGLSLLINDAVYYYKDNPTYYYTTMYLINMFLLKKYNTYYDIMILKNIKL